MKTQGASLVLFGTLLSMPVCAAEYSCEVTRKLNRDLEYTAEQIRRFQFTNRLEELSSGAFVSRCSLEPSAGKVTCDRYRVDQLAFDANANIKKYYVFRSQYDFQLFPNLTFVENDGRGGVSFGECSIESP